MANIFLLGAIWPYFLLTGGLCLVAGAVASVLIYIAVNKSKLDKNKIAARKIIEDAYNEVKTIKKDAVAECNTLKKESILEAKEEVHKLKIDCDIELRDRRTEVQRVEDRLALKEEQITKDAQAVAKQKADCDAIKERLLKEEELTQQKKDEIISKLESVAHYTKEQAKKELISEIEEDAKQNASKYAKEIVSTAIQKVAVDQTSESTVSVISIPNDEVKGRIIGREGRNIKAFETATGVDVIIDDTPEAITLSSFDPIRREVARLSLEKLILDGRIQPARIEEIVEKVRRDVEITMKEAGELTVEEAGIVNIHPEIVKVLGKLKYRTSYGQNVLKHSLEVCLLAGAMAGEIGANIEIAKRGGLLHDIGKGLDFEQEGTHVQLGVELARKYKESPAVIHCIEAHHGNVEYKSIEAVLVQAADAISSSRPGARRESLENYIKRLRQLEEIANSFKGVDKSYAIQAGREIRIIVKPEEVSDKDTAFMAKDIAKRIESEMEYPGQIKVNVIRETRSAEYAK